MKTTFLSLTVLALCIAANTGHAQGTAFTYQGRLTEGGGPANGSYDFTFVIYGSQSGGSAASGIATNTAVPVTNGVFTVRLDFGAGVFTGPDRWLEIGVRTNGASAFSALSPRQPALPTPYAMHASNADLLDGMNFTAFAQAAHTHSAGEIVSGVLAPARGGTGIDTSATPAGSLLRTSGTGTWSPLAPGANGQVLKISGGQPVWGADNNSGGTVTSVNTGSGLVGGPITTSGTIAIDVAVVPQLGANNTFSGSNIFAGVIVATNASNSFAGTFSGSGGALSNLNASALSGPVPGGAIAGTYSNAVTFDNGANTFNGSFRGNGSALSNVNAATLNGLASSDIWQLGGNNVAPGQFLGSINDQPLELRVNGGRALRLEPNTNGAPNVVGGSPRNQVDAGVVGATIGGGGAANYFGLSYTNRVSADFGAIGGGADNVIQQQAYSATIAGGYLNTIQYLAYWSAIGGGYRNIIGSNSALSSIAGGWGNVLEGGVFASSIGGGYENTNASGSGFIAGGTFNRIQKDSYAASIGGGYLNRIETNAGLSVIAGGQENLIDSFAGQSVIGGGWGNLIETRADQSVIVGGNNSSIGAGARESFIGGGFANVIGTNAGFSFIGAGTGNTIGTDSIWGTIAGGENNLIRTNTVHATIAGGQSNTTAANDSSIGGGTNNVIQAVSTASIIAGGQNNIVRNTSPDATISGGARNSIGTNSDGTVIAGGSFNVIGNIADFSTIGGGRDNRAEGFFSTIAGGTGNLLGQGSGSFIGGGGFDGFEYGGNVSTGSANVVVGGINNLASGRYASIGGGAGNIARGNASTVPGGISNNASAYGFAAGRRAKANHQGSFVWADSTDADFATTALNQFLVRASGGVGIGVTNPSSALEVAGVVRAGAFEGNGSGLTSLSGANLAPGSIGASALGNNVVASGNIVDGSVIPSDLQTSVFGTTFWKVDGNAGTIPGAHFLGTTDNQALELRVNNIRALLLQPSGGAPNVIGGSPANAVALGVRGAFIGGGEGNVAGGDGATAAGGVANHAAGNHASVGGGLNNRSAGTAGTVAGGENNLSGDHAAVGGGLQNLSSGQYATVPGGRLNDAAGPYSFAAGHRAKANHAGAFVWADSTDADFSSTASDQFSVRATGGVRLSSDTPNLSFDGANTSILFPPTSGANAPMIHMFRSGENNSARMVLAHSPAYPGWGLQYDDAPDKFHFLSDGFQVMTVDLGNSRVGIGTTRPARRLQVGDNAVRGSEGMIRLASRTSTSIVNNQRTWELGVPQTGDDLTGDGYSFVIRDVDFGADRMVINWIGNVGIGATNPTERLEVAGISQGSLSLSGNLSGYGANTYPTLKTSGSAIYFDANGTYTGYITHNSGFTDVSDGTLKTDVRRIDGALDKVSRINGVRFKWKDGRDHGQDHMGVIAQEVEEVAPELVSQPEGIRTKGVNYGGLNALTIEAIKELKERQEKSEKEIRRLHDNQRTVPQGNAEGVPLAAIQGLNQKVEEQGVQLGQKETEIAELKQRLERLERFLIKNDAP